MRSTPRRLRWLVAMALVGLLGLYPLLAPTPHRIDQAHADLITAGMTKDQVEAIFGVPAGPYDWAEEGGHQRFLVYLRLVEVEALLADYESAGVTRTPIMRSTDPPRTNLTWTSRHGMFVIWFDEEERVISTNSCTEVRVVPPWKRWWNHFWKK